MNRVLYILVFFFLFFNNANSDTKIAYIDIDFIISNSVVGKSINEKLKIKHESNIKKFSKTESSIKEEEKQLLKG